VTGTLVNVASAITAPGKSINVAGIFVTLNCKALTAGKTSNIILSNVIVGNMAAVAIPLELIQIQQVVVASSGDVNLDGKVDMADMNAIYALIGTVAVAGARTDVNADGKIDVLDMILIGQQWAP
jgi:hypothetical protein